MSLTWDIWWYHDHWLKKDVLLLADVFETFIDTCVTFYGIDPCHYFSSPGLSWDAMLKMTGMKLKKIVDIEMYLFIEKKLRGGISQIAKRYAKGNNPKKMPLKNRQDIYRTLVWIICMVWFGWYE